MGYGEVMDHPKHQSQYHQTLRVRAPIIEYSLTLHSSFQNPIQF